jgi:hypothetical protein
MDIRLSAFSTQTQTNMELLGLYSWREIALLVFLFGGF